MTKARFVQVRDRVGPVFLALALWLVGNTLVGVQGAKGQEVADGHFQVPTPKPIIYSLHNNCGTDQETDQVKCTRFREEVWGCRGGGGIFDNCDSSKYQSVSVYYETTSKCKGLDGVTTADACDWGGSFVTSMKQSDKCEKSSVKTGKESCVIVSLPASEKKTLPQLRIASNNEQNCRTFSPLASEVDKIDA